MPGVRCGFPCAANPPGRGCGQSEHGRHRSHQRTRLENRFDLPTRIVVQNLTLIESRRVGQNLLEIHDHHRFRITDLDYPGHQTATLGHHHRRWTLDIFPGQMLDTIDRVDPERLHMPVVLGNDQIVGLSRHLDPAVPG